MGDGGVAMAALLFRPGDFLVDIDVLAIGVAPDQAEDLENRAYEVGGDDVGDDDGAGIDERVARQALFGFQLDERIEGIARRFASDPLPDARRTRRLQGEGQSENLGNALDGEGRIAVPDHIFASIHAADRHAELVWIDARQRRDVVRNPPLADLFASLALAGRQEG